MRVLFRLERVPNPPRELIGYGWLDIIAIEPRALAKRPDDYGDWCVNLIENDYICRTDQGIARISSRDVWDAIEHGEYVLADGE